VYRVSQENQAILQAADAAFDQLKQDLLSAEWCRLGESQVERLVTERGREVMLRLLQAHIVVRCAQEPVNRVIGADGAERTHLRVARMRELDTTLGTVYVTRTVHHGRHISALHPVDADLNLPFTRYSLELERASVLAAIDLSYEDSVDLVGRTTGTKLAKRPIETIMARSACDAAGFYNRRRGMGAGLDVDCPLQILTFDQKGVVVREEDLSPETLRIRKALPRRMRAIHNRNGKKNWVGRKRMAIVSAVYNIDPDRRSAEDFVRGLRRLQPVPTTSPREVRPQRKWVAASLSREPQEVVDEAFAEAKSRDPHQQKTWIVLVDGDPKLRRWVSDAARRHQVRVIVALDIIHALQHLWKAGQDLFGRDDQAVERWALPRLQRILEGDVSAVVAGMTRSATIRGLTRSRRANIDRTARYFLARKTMMRYDELLRIGAPIATGVIEGTCKHLINDRLDRCGARWSIRGAEAVLTLRAIAKNGDFDDYWAFHEDQEHKRNHRDRYLDATPTPLTNRIHLRAVK
jgi:hypothetical protein